MSYIADVRIDPLLKWPGGKTGELSLILENLPPKIDRYFEPFLGGGAVFFALSKSIPAIINDASDDLIEFYTCVANGDKDFSLVLEQIKCSWRALEIFVERHHKKLTRLYKDYSQEKISESELKKDIAIFVDSCSEELNKLSSSDFYYDNSNFNKEVRKNLASKIMRMNKIEQDRGELPLSDIIKNIEGALKSSFYMHLRHLYNHPKEYQIPASRHSAFFYFIREYAYASMFRFNGQGKFNVPYGGIGYNRKNMSKKIEKLQDAEVIEKLQSSKIECMDFLSLFKKYPPKKHDFIFLDPPYDSDFSDYDKNLFNLDDQSRLATFLTKTCKANFMLVIKSTKNILSLYEGYGLNIKPFDKKYMWTIKERNDRDVVHLMITNY